ncbi:MAG: hypothetical protein A2Y25_02060 [Candidatus Melainabacteria bacterium GWF2_37_15]|nr:MAG: hypothetical protein A2Y25_02060 [Candidatus Melainabacteria bacterium GWF2_37_15]
MSNKEKNINEQSNLASNLWDWGSGTFNSLANVIKRRAFRKHDSTSINLAKKVGTIKPGQGSIVGGGITWAETGDWKAGATAGITGYFAGKGALDEAITAKAFGGHIKAGTVRTGVGILYLESLTNMLYNIPAHANDPAWEPQGFLADSWLLQFENYLLKTDKKAYKELQDLKTRILQEEIRRNNEILNDQIAALKEKYINPYLKELDKFEKKFQNFVEEIAGNHPDLKHASSGTDPNLRFNDPNAETPSMAADRLKHDPAPRQGHYDPSSLTPQQQAQYLKHDPSMKDPSLTNQQYSESLKEFFKRGETIETLGQMGKDAWSAMFDKPSGNVLQGKVEIKDFYHPATEQVNYSATARVMNQDGKPIGLEGIPDLSDTSQPPGVAAQPFDHEKPSGTPNSQKIKDVLYGGVKLAGDYVAAYNIARIKNKLYGRDLKKVDAKLQKAKGYRDMYSLGKWAAQAAWKSIAKTALGQAMSSAWAPIGQALSTASTWVTTQLGVVWTALTNIPIIGTAIAAVGTAVATALSWALTALAFLPW